MTELQLEHGWQLRKREAGGTLSADEARELASTHDDNWLDAEQMPMQVHDVLASLGRLPAPGRMGSTEAGAWVCQNDWIYRLLLPDIPEAQSYDLLCEGLDTVADVWLNGVLLHEHRSCYLPAEIALDQALQPGQTNCLLLHFRAPEPWAQQELAGKLTAFEKEMGLRGLNMLRKPRQDFGNFLGPRFTPIGPYGPIRLRAHDGNTLDLFSACVQVDDRRDLATIQIEASGRCSSQHELQLRLCLLNPQGGKVASLTAEPDADQDQWQVCRRIDVQSPQRWHVRNTGPQALYQLQGELTCDGKTTARQSRQLGFRSLEQQGPFDFSINGKTTRLWGVNIPPLQPGHVWNPQKANRLLDLVEQANCNTIRIWGPGQPYDNSHLLAEADRRGLLVWFEFPHEFHPHPENESFISSCLAEAKHYLKSFRHHASILLWCGGNEAYLTLDPAFAPEDALKSQMGRPLFDIAYRELVTQLDPTRSYVAQSPSGGSYANSPLAGDTHCYNDLAVVPGIGWPIMATEHFRYTVPRPWSLRKWLGDEAWPEGFVSRLRDNNSGGLIPESWRALCTGGALGTYMFGPLGDFYDTGDRLEGLVEKLDAASMKYIRRSVERMRRGRSRQHPAGQRICRGHLWWKFNDTWPKLRNALIDACGEVSGSYYALKRAYEPLLLSFEIDEDDRVLLWAVNDTPQRVEATVHVQRLDETGSQVLQELERPVLLEPDASEPVADLSIWGSFFRNTLLVASLSDEEGETLTQTTDMIAPEITTSVVDPELTATVDGDRVTLRAKSFARRVTLRGPLEGPQAFGWLFDDNYFDLLPGIEKQVRVLSRPQDAKEFYVRASGQKDPLCLQ